MSSSADGGFGGPRWDVGGIRRYLRGLRSWQLLVLSALLLSIDLVVPDPIPFIDEALMAVITFLLACWKKRG